MTERTTRSFRTTRIAERGEDTRYSIVTLVLHGLISESEGGVGVAAPASKRFANNSIINLKSLYSPKFGLEPRGVAAASKY